MRRKTYRALLIFSCVLVIASLVLAIGLLSRQHSDSFCASNKSDSPSSQHSGQVEKPITAKPSSDNQGDTAKTLPFTIHFFDVGEGDSALIECDGHFMLIDGGESSSSSYLFSYLKQHNIDYLDYIICSHAHSDHVGGLAGALNYASVGYAFAPVTEYNNRAFISFTKYLQAQGVSITVPTPGDVIMLGEARITFIGPVDMTLSALNHNNASLIVRIEYGETSFLFTGDAEIEEELSVLKSGINLQSDVLKVAHHGSYTSSSEQFLKAVSPQYAVISVGRYNEYAHPHDAALDRLSRFCSTIYRTDMNGEIVCKSDGTTIVFSFDD